MVHFKKTASTALQNKEEITAAVLLGEQFTIAMILRLKGHQNHQKALFKQRELGSTARVPHSIVLGWGLGIFPKCFIDISDTQPDMGYTLQNVRYLSILITVAAVIATIHRAGACNVELLISTTALTLCYAKSLQSCPTLCDPIDGSPPGSPVPGILQARTLEWVAISFSNA